MECGKQGNVAQIQCRQDAAAIKQTCDGECKDGVELKDMQMKAVLCFVGGRDLVFMHNCV